MPGTNSDTVTNRPEKLPDFDELPMIEALGLRHAWDVLDQNLGTIALTTPEKTAAAARLVRTGTVVGLNLPVTEPDPPLFGREPLQHQIFSIDRNTLDDRLDAFYPQASSQWDGLRHVRCREYGFFGGTDTEMGVGEGPLGIENWAERGIVGRGVLLDVAEHRRKQGRPLDPFSSETIASDELSEVAEAQGVEIHSGDILCIRTGWVEAYRALERSQREEVAREPRFTGLLADEDMARFLWNTHVAAVALDNPAVEAVPGDPKIGSLHRRVLPLLGLALAEMLPLGELANLCLQDNVWEFLFVSAPLNVPGGVGSPSNAVAIR